MENVPNPVILPGRLPSAERAQSTETGKVSRNIKGMALAAALGAAALGCTQDREVYRDNPVSEGTGGSGGTETNVGGSAGSGGETSVTLPGADRKNVWQTFSFDINENDAYDTMGYYREKDNQLKVSVLSEDDMEDALYDNEGRKFQYVADGSYSESFKGLLKGFCEYRTGSCGPDVGFKAGYDCVDSDGDSRLCTLAGVLQLSEAASGSPDGELPASPIINLGFQESQGDECEPVVFCFGSEHGISFDDNGVYTMAFNPNLTVNTTKSLQINSDTYKGLPKTQE